MEDADRVNAGLQADLDNANRANAGLRVDVDHASRTNMQLHAAVEDITSQLREQEGIARQKENDHSQLLEQFQALNVEFQDVMGRLGMVHNMVQDGEALRTENGRCRMVIKELWADIQSMKLGTVLAIARARQYEAEFDSILEEWNRNARLRSLLLTSWPVEETMYLPEWAADAYQAPHGSLYWHLIEDETHNFDVEKVYDFPDAFRGMKMWPNPHPMMADDSRCTLCQNPFGPEGCFTVGSCGAQFHSPCLISCMIKKRSCPHCRSPFHSRLYLQFGLLKYMPSNWVCDPRYLPFPLGEWIGQEMEWSWRHQRSKVENLYREEDGEWITDPTQILYAANELYLGKPNTHGLKGYFFQTLNWHWHEPIAGLCGQASTRPSRHQVENQQDRRHQSSKMLHSSRTLVVLLKQRNCTGKSRTIGAG